MDLEFDHATFSGQVPLFPLPGTVLLPGGLLPLHVFEPRYRLMARAAVDGERLIAMAHLRPGYEADYEGAPEIAPHVCVGRVLMDDALPDGRWNLLLLGLRRARVLSEDRSRPYRVATVEVLEDPARDPERERALALALARLLRRIPDDLVRDPQRRAVVLQKLARTPAPGGLAFGTLLDLAADALLLGVVDRQRLLAAHDAEPRLEALAEVLGRRAAELEALRRPAAWPPRFSRN